VPTPSAFERILQTAICILIPGCGGGSLVLGWLAVFEANKNIGWLRAALPQVERYHAYWTSMPQLR
jgi:hypothetical protein